MQQPHQTLRIHLNLNLNRVSNSTFIYQGFLPEAVICYLSLLGWNDGSDKEVYTPAELVKVVNNARHL